MADVYNVIRGDGVFFEGMTKEQIISAIAEATGKTVDDIDSAFITKLKEINKGNALRLWMGTNAEYNKIEPKEDDVLYYVTDDTFVEDISSSIVDMQNKIDANYDSLTEDFNTLENLVMNTMNNFENEIKSIKDVVGGTPTIKGTGSVDASNVNKFEINFGKLSTGNNVTFITSNSVTGRAYTSVTSDTGSCDIIFNKPIDTLNAKVTCKVYFSQHYGSGYPDDATTLIKTQEITLTNDSFVDSDTYALNNFCTFSINANNNYRLKLELTFNGIF